MLKNPRQQGSRRDTQTNVNKHNDLKQLDTPPAMLRSMMLLSAYPTSSIKSPFQTNKRFNHCLTNFVVAQRRKSKNISGKTLQSAQKLPAGPFSSKNGTPPSTTQLVFLFDHFEARHLRTRAIRHRYNRYNIRQLSLAKREPFFSLCPMPLI